MKILIAEDEAFNQIVLEEMIQLLYTGVEIQIADDGAQALEKLEKEHFDLVLSDVDMPVMNGYELVSQIKKVKGMSTPVVCVTAFAVTGDKEKLLLHGFDDYISKPINVSQLQDVLSKYLI